jgi:toxin ParE1/3/4
MSFGVVLRRQAQAEFDSAIDWYEQQRSGLGAEFAEQVQDAFDRIASMPEVHPPVYRDVRKALVRRFPHVIFYRVKDDRVVVLAVVHSKRDPEVWKSRS